MATAAGADMSSTTPDIAVAVTQAAVRERRRAVRTATVPTTAPSSVSSRRRTDGVSGASAVHSSGVRQLKTLLTA